MHFALGQVFQRNRTNKIYIGRDLLLGIGSWDYVAEKSYDLPFANWTLRKPVV